MEIDKLSLSQCHAGQIRKSIHGPEGAILGECCPALDLSSRERCPVKVRDYVHILRCNTSVFDEVDMMM